MVGLISIDGSAFNRPFDVSGDGSRIVGTTSSGFTAIDWVNRKPRVLPTPSVVTLSEARGISDDGLVAVGAFHHPVSWNPAARWRGDDVAEPLSEQILFEDSIAHATSADGGVIVGTRRVPGTTPYAFRWTEQTGFLPLVFGQVSGTDAYCLTSDGNAVAGTISVSTSFIWQAGIGTFELPLVPGTTSFQAFGISDSRAVVGRAFGGSSFLEQAAIWTPEHGSRLLETALEEEHGLILPGWHLSRATAITPDGLTIVGSGINPAGIEEAWIVRVPEPSGLVPLLLMAFLLRRARCRAAFGAITFLALIHLGGLAHAQCPPAPQPCNELCCNCDHNDAYPPHDPGPPITGVAAKRVISGYPCQTDETLWPYSEQWCPTAVVPVCAGSWIRLVGYGLDCDLFGPENQACHDCIRYDWAWSPVFVENSPDFMDTEQAFAGPLYHDFEGAFSVQLVGATNGPNGCLNSDASETWTGGPIEYRFHVNAPHLSQTATRYVPLNDDFDESPEPLADPIWMDWENPGLLLGDDELRYHTLGTSLPSVTGWWLAASANQIQVWGYDGTWKRMTQDAAYATSNIVILEGVERSTTVDEYGSLTVQFLPNSEGINEDWRDDPPSIGCGCVMSTNEPNNRFWVPFVDLDVPPGLVNGDRRELSAGWFIPLNNDDDNGNCKEDLSGDDTPCTSGCASEDDLVQGGLLLALRAGEDPEASPAYNHGTVAMSLPNPPALRLWDNPSRAGAPITDLTWSDLDEALPPASFYIEGLKTGTWNMNVEWQAPHFLVKDRVKVTVFKGDLHIEGIPPCLENKTSFPNDCPIACVVSGEQRAVGLEVQPVDLRAAVRLSWSPRVTIRLEPGGPPIQEQQQEYDYLGRRVEKAVTTFNGSTWASSPVTSRVRFVYDGWLLLAELDGAANNTVIRKYTWGLDLAGLSGSLNDRASAGGIGGLLAMEDLNPATTQSGAYVYSYDANGNVSELLDADTGAVAAHYEYDAYGNATTPADPADANPFRFSTKYFDLDADANAGLGYWGYRYYSARLGRWLSRDMIGELGGLHLLSYCSNLPIAAVDAIGLDVRSLTAEQKADLPANADIRDVPEAPGVCRIHVYTPHNDYIGSIDFDCSDNPCSTVDQDASIQAAMLAAKSLAAGADLDRVRRALLTGAAGAEFAIRLANWPLDTAVDTIDFINDPQLGTFLAVVVPGAVGRASALARCAARNVANPCCDATGRILRKLTQPERDVLRTEGRAIWEAHAKIRAQQQGLEVHHRIPLEYAHLFPSVNPNRLTNLVGVPAVPHSDITQAWLRWGRNLGHEPTSVDVMTQACRIDEQFGDVFRSVPP
ncbi:tRNA(Glu)-specific nuclease WapA precursor [Phycisphaerae bacterium RAS1]|nr:tRNA(Glu)-specific nuclease WapA precursor [Phycisphaerae bacterium RAS1]